MRNIYTAKLKDALHNATVASQAKGEFLSNMSHEMRTPLNAITGMTAIGKSAKDMERKDYALDKIENASTHLLGVINDVLDMSKIEANMLELSPVEFVFEKMLQKVVTVINFRIDEKKQKLTVHIDREIPQTLIADDQRLAQVITNLLGNAVKFTPEKGSIHLDTQLLKTERDICTIQISVKDSGIGISAEQQKKLFQSFQQAESSTARKFGGTGLGLAISKSIVEMMGGMIWVQAEPEKGSTFAFTVQVKCGDRQNKGLFSPGVNLGNVRIMVVDDDPDILTYFRDITQELGVLCDIATGGEEALALMKQKDNYHIYFVDWKMPGLDGIQLAAEIKARMPENSVIIMISAAEWSTIAEEAKKAGVKKFLSKPLFPTTIAEIINECIDGGKEQGTEAEVNVSGLFEGRRILLVEDVDINREIVMTLLEPTRLEIDCAENGIQAVRMFIENPDRYDLIFMDIQMPEMDGYEATRRIRALDVLAAKNIPIIAMTANVFKEDIQKCLDAGMDSHVGKPLAFEEVLEKLKSYLLKS
jgi:CheY-like chemotaxis protein